MSGSTGATVLQAADNIFSQLKVSSARRRLACHVAMLTAIASAGRERNTQYVEPPSAASVKH